jgi:hypothetical protein
MSAGGWMMGVAGLIALGTLVVLMHSLLRSIRNERTEGRSVWREFSLGLVLAILFFATWIGHVVAEWQVYTDEQRSHGERTEIGDFVSEFAQSTLENWQSEFLQLFSFVALAALYIHKGSAESKDGEDNLSASLRRIEEHLGTLPPTAPNEPGRTWKLPETPLELQDRVIAAEVAARRMGFGGRDPAQR